MPTNVQTINLEDITPVGARVGGGRYRARLLSAEGKMSKRDKPMVETAYEIVSGKDKQGSDQDGGEVRIWFSLAVTQKNGKTYAGGIIEAKRSLNVVGQGLANDFKFPLDKDIAAKLIAQRLKKAGDLEIVVIEEKSEDLDDDGNNKVYTRAKIVGAWKGASKDDNGSGGPQAKDEPDFDFGLDDE